MSPSHLRNSAPKAFDALGTRPCCRCILPGSLSRNTRRLLLNNTRTSHTLCYASWSAYVHRTVSCHSRGRPAFIGLLKNSVQKLKRVSVAGRDKNKMVIVVILLCFHQSRRSIKYRIKYSIKSSFYSEPC